MRWKQKANRGVAEGLYHGLSCTRHAIRGLESYEPLEMVRIRRG